MSFNFQWPEFSRQFHQDAAAMLDSALNRGPKPKVIADDIKVEDIHMGSIPPELEMLEIGELSTDRFRGIFRLTYAGNAHLLLSTKVQANPLTRPTPAEATSQFEDVSSAFPTSMPSRGILFAARPLVVPMKLRLSQMRLKAIVVLVVSKQKGITLVFKNDPLESVDVSSTFDSVAVIQKYLQQEIEGQLREMFREDLPGIIHRLSQRWLSSQGNKAKSNAKTATQKPSSPPSAQADVDTLPSHGPRQRTSSSGGKQRRVSESKIPSSTVRSPSRRRKSEKASHSPSASPRVPQRSTSSTIGGAEVARSPSKKGSVISQDGEKNNSKLSKSPKKRQEENNTSVSLLSSSDSADALGSSFANDIARYDPTYGLRPDEVRMSASGSTYSGLAKLTGRAIKGLGDLMIAEEDTKAREEQEGSQGLAAIDAEDLPLDLLEEDHKSGVFDAEDDDCSVEREYESHDSQGDDVPDIPSVDFSEAAENDVDEDDDDDDDDDDERSEQSGDEKVPSSDGEASALRDNSIFDSFSLFSRDEARPHRPASVSLPATATKGRRAGRASVQNLSNTRNRERTLVEYETIPAVGGGTITRPRVYHIASTVQAPDVEEDDDPGAENVASSIIASSTARGPPSSRTMTQRFASSSRQDMDNISHEEEDVFGRNDDGFFDESATRSPSAIGHDSLATLEPEPMDPSSREYKNHLYRQQLGGLYRPGYGRHSSVSSTDRSSNTSTGLRKQGRLYSGSLSGPSTAPTSSRPSIRVSSSEHFVPMHESVRAGQGLDTIRQSPSASPSKARVASSGFSSAMTLDASNHFMDLVNSNHTLSPFTRTLDTKGFAVRSRPMARSGSDGAASDPRGNSRDRSRNGNQRKSTLSAKSHTGPPSPSSGLHDAIPRVPSYAASATSSGSAKAGRRRVFRLGSSSDVSKTTSGAQTPASSVAGSTRPDALAESARTPNTLPYTRSQSSTSLDQIHGSNASSSGPPSSRSSAGGWHVSGVRPLTSSPVVTNRPPGFTQMSTQKRPALDATRRRSAALFGEEYVARTMGSIRE